jgi:hypothetical protein
MKTLIAVFSAFPAVLETVQAVEMAIPLPNVGQQKLNLVLNAAGAAWELGEVAEQINKTNWLAAVQAMTTIAVAGLNAVGVFGTSAGPSSFSGTPVATTTAAAPVSSN